MDLKIKIKAVVKEKLSQQDSMAYAQWLKLYR
jgi:hypothetical protein